VRGLLGLTGAVAVAGLLVGLVGAPAVADDGSPTPVGTGLGCVDGYAASLDPLQSSGRWYLDEVTIVRCGVPADDSAVPAGWVSLTPADTAPAQPQDDPLATRIYEGNGSVGSAIAGFDETVPAVLRFQPDDGSTVTWHTTLTSGSRPAPTLVAHSYLSWTGSPSALSSTTMDVAELDVTPMRLDANSLGIASFAPRPTGTVSVSVGGAQVGTLFVQNESFEWWRYTDLVLQTLTADGDEWVTGPGVPAGTTTTFHYSGDANYAPADVTVRAEDRRAPQSLSLSGGAGDTAGYELDLGSVLDDSGYNDAGPSLIDHGRYTIAVDGKRYGSVVLVTTDAEESSGAEEFGLSLVFSTATKAPKDTTLALAPGEVVPLPALPGGRHVVTVAYGGTTSSLPAQVSRTIEVARVPSYWTAVALSHGRVAAGSTATLTGTLVPSGRPVSVGGVPVAVQRRFAGSTSWTTVAHATTTTGGGVVANLRVDRSASYRLVASSTSAMTGAISPSRAVVVTRSLKVSTSAPRQGVTRLSVRVTPTARVYLQVKHGSSWRTVTSHVPHTSTAGVGTTTFDVHRTAHRQTFRLYVRADSKGSSASRTVAVRALA